MTVPARALAVTMLLGACGALAQHPVAAREQLNAVLWQQAAAEYRGAVMQSYRDATRRLVVLKSSRVSASVEQAAMGNFAWKPPAVVLDVDETVLDNSAYNAGLVVRGRSFDATSWDAWVQTRQAKPVPGAAEFVRRARQLGYRVVYISNRSCNRDGGYDPQGRALECPQKAATLDNLERALGYRPAESDLLLQLETLGRDDSDKQARRLAVAQTYRIVMQVGDDLNDFIRRADYSEQAHDIHWGTRWFLLPNPVYGSWERRFPAIADKYAALSAWTAPEPVPREEETMPSASWGPAATRPTLHAGDSAFLR